MTDSTRSLGLDNGNERSNCGILGESGAEWQMAATSVHNDVFLDSEECHEREANCAMPALIRWWEALTAPEVAKRQQKYRVERDATDGRNGRAQRTVREVLMEM